jgi:hypothetical protein
MYQTLQRAAGRKETEKKNQRQEKEKKENERETQIKEEQEIQVIDRSLSFARQPRSDP